MYMNLNVTDWDFNNLFHDLIGYCMDVHITFGHGLLKSYYVDCQGRDLSLKKISFQLNPVRKSVIRKFFHTKLPANLIIDGKVPVAIKAVEQMIQGVEAQ